MRQAARADPLGGGAIIPEVEETDDEVANADPLQHAVEAHVIEMEVREAVDDDAEKDEYDGAYAWCASRAEHARGAFGKARVGGEDD